MRPSPALPWYGYFNPLPPHGGRLSHPPRCPKLNNISIHSLRMEGDPCTFHPPASQKRFQSTPSAWRETHGFRFRILRTVISIHSLRMEGDIRPWCYQRHGQPFQSTPSAWRETVLRQTVTLPSGYFNPLPPHGGRRFIFSPHVPHLVISIHSLRMEGDLIYLATHRVSNYFNPLPPHGGRRADAEAEERGEGISIHSLRMEGDTIILMSTGK